MKPVQRAIAERLEGDRPSVPRALLAAGGAGVVVAGVVYRLLRR